MITAILPIFNILRIVNLGGMITEINITKAIILIITITIITIAVNYGKKSITFVAKKVIALISISMISNNRQKNFEDKTENSIEIKINTMHL